ncbi:MAG: hypothetical protein KAS32_23880 [Candidatus Peribacteraceae bacterium]|nr:hypothetical protein [Candidatus Peribacteraceae bacterium]
MSQIEIEPGDRVVDPWDNAIREVVEIVDDTVFMADGGVMAADEIDTVYLPSEDIPGDR